MSLTTQTWSPEMKPDSAAATGLLVGVVIGLVMTLAVIGDSCDKKASETLSVACGDHCERGAQCGGFTCTASGWRQ
jgi:hypothetical protein